MDEGIELKPTPDGYLRMAIIFFNEVISNTEDGKRKASFTMLQSFAQITVYLSHNYPDEYQKLKDHLGF